MRERLTHWGRGVLAGLFLAAFDLALCLYRTPADLSTDDVFRAGLVALIAGPIAGLLAALILMPLAVRRPLSRSPASRRIVAVLLIIGSVTTVYVDATLYVNLYAWAHWVLGAVALATMTLGFLSFRFGSWTRWFALGGLVIFLTSPWLGPHAFGPGQVVRRAVVQETTLIGRIAKAWPGPDPQQSKTACRWPNPSIPPASGTERPSILLITVDAWRADLADEYLSKAMPKFAQRVRHGVHFKRAYAAATRTNESIYSLLTGRWPHRLDFVTAGVDSRDQFRQVDDTFSVKQSHQLPLRDQTSTLAGMLGAHGYQTAAMVPYVFFLRGAGITRGFKHIDDRAYQEANRSNRGVTSRILTDQAMAWVSQTNSPWLLWIHYLDPHTPYDPYGGVPSGAPMFERYVSELRRVDDQLHRLFSHLEAEKQLADTMVIVAADHGEEFRDHGGLFHGTTVYEEQARVPLFVMGPGITRQTIEEPVSLVDVVPTIVDWVGASGTQPMDGRSLAGALNGEGTPMKTPRPLLIQSTREGKRLGLVMGRYKYIYDPGNQLEEVYDLKLDPNEKKNRVDTLPTVRDTGRCLLKASGVSVSPSR